MGKFGRALAGGIAGAAGAAGEVFDARMKDKIDMRKEKVLAKRQLFLQSEGHRLAGERDVTNREARYGQEDIVRAENRAFVEGDKPSGQVHLGMPLSKQDLSRQSDLDKGKNLSVEAYADSERAKDYTEKKEFKELSIAGQIEVAEAQKTVKDDKPLTAAEKKRIKQNATTDFYAKISSYEPTATLDEKGIAIDLIGKSEAEIAKIKADVIASVKSKGFDPSTVSIQGEELKIYLTGFNLDKYQAGLKTTGLAQPEKVNETDKTKKTTFDELFNVLNKNTPGSNVNGESVDDGLISSHAIGAPINQPQRKASYLRP